VDLSKLPFVVQPKREPIFKKVEVDGGYFEVPIYGYLTTGEKSFFQQALGSDDSTLQIISLARQVGAEESIDLDSAYQLVLKAISGGEDPKVKDIQYKFNKELTEVLSGLSLMAEKEMLVSAAIILKFRVNNNIEFDDVMGFPPELVSQLADIYQAEASGDASILESKEEREEKNKEPESVVEMEKKPSRRKRTTTEAV